MATPISWDDYRIAYAVANEGGLSQAGRLLNINHATVLRHINRLEQNLGLKLFIRHQRGYQLTDAGRVMLAELPQIQHHFSRLENQLQDVNDQLAGTLRITTVPTHSPHLNPAIVALRQDFQELRIEICATDDIIPLEKGLVHVAIRPGVDLDGPDLIVRKITEINFNFYASEEYLSSKTIPNRQSNLNDYDWVLPSGPKRNIPVIKQVLDSIAPDKVIYQSNHFSDVADAVASGLGIGPLAQVTANHAQGLVKLDLFDMQNNETLWFVYHKDLRHSRKINVLYEYLIKYLAPV